MKLLALALLAVIAVSGCTLPGAGPQTGVTGNGIAIENFEADFPQAFSEEVIQLQARVRNTGSVEADSVEASILGLDGWTGCTSEWAVGTLLAPDPVRGTAGESDTHIWSDCRAPSVAAGLSLTHTPTLRLFYHTESQVLKAVTIVSQDELRRTQNLNQALPAETLSASASPVALSIEVKGPIRVFESDGSVEFPVEVKLSNVGGGVACYGGGIQECKSGEGWNQVLVSLKSASANVQIPADCVGREVTLWRGKDNSFVCTVKVSGITTQSGAAQKVLSASADYIYFIDKATSVTVTGR